jgi:CHAT domain-containing protein
MLSEAIDRDVNNIARFELTGDQHLANRYRTAVQQLRMLTATPAGQGRRESLLAAHRQLQELLELIDDGTGEAPSPIGALLSRVVTEQSPLVYLVPCTDTGVGIVVTANPFELKIIAMPGMSRPEVDEIARKFNAALLNFEQPQHDPKATDAWRSALENTLAWCWANCMEKVLATVGSVPELILVPLGRLGRLPLHTTQDQGRSVMAACACRYAPGARLLSQLVETSPDSLVAVSYSSAEERLAFSRQEVTAAATHFSNARLIEGEAAISAVVAKELEKGNVFHFACHATSDANPERSGVLLADGIFSLRDLLNLRLAPGSIAILSACETGVIADDLPDEVQSLASGMLQVGCSAVISSLWPVPDLSTAILMIRFHHLWRAGSQPAAQALHQAQRWMQQAEFGDIADLLSDRRYSKSWEDFLRSWKAEPAAKPFQDPMHWAAFTFAGLG